MKGVTSGAVIVPEAEGYLQVPTIQEGKFAKVKCYYSPEFTSTLLSDNDVLESSPYRKEYSGQSMLKFFEPDEVNELPTEERDKIKMQKLDDVTNSYNNNFGNCILSCTHKKKSNRNLYIPGIIRGGLCFTMPLMIPSGLSSRDSTATIYNSRSKAYKEDPSFCKSCKLKKLELIYEHKQNEHIKLMEVLESVPEEFHKLPFHRWIQRNTPVHALREKAHEMLWNQRLIHLAPSSI